MNDWCHVSVSIGCSLTVYLKFICTWCLNTERHRHMDITCRGNFFPNLTLRFWTFILVYYVIMIQTGFLTVASFTCLVFMKLSGVFSWWWKHLRGGDGVFQFLASKNKEKNSSTISIWRDLHFCHHFPANIHSFVEVMYLF